MAQKSRSGVRLDGRKSGSLGSVPGAGCRHEFRAGRSLDALQLGLGLHQRSRYARACHTPTATKAMSLSVSRSTYEASREQAPAREA